jgi:F420-dependent methylenetetrahydromethanopterin dehydrogenase
LTVADRDGLTVIVYRLAAKPAFDVPAFLLKRLLKRDAVDYCFCASPGSEDPGPTERLQQLACGPRVFRPWASA